MDLEQNDPAFLSTFDVGEMCSIDENVSFGPYTGC